jgi:cysteine desulfurase
MRKSGIPPRVYLDCAATTPVRPEVRAAMEPFLSEEAFGNPSSQHWAGRPVRAALEDARRSIAGALGCDAHEVYFTSGGTEADNLAVLGTALAARARGAPFRVAVGATEHKAVIDAARVVERLGGEAIFLPVDGDGRVDLDAVEAALERGAALLSVMWVNNETGTVQDVAALARRAAAAGTTFHTDAVQALGKIPCRMAEGITLLTISGHKIGAPKGVGALVVRDPDVLEPLLHGGGQQHGVRPGTENVVGAVGLGRAAELAGEERDHTAAHTGRLRGDLERRVMEAIPDTQVNGAGGDRAPHIANLSIPGTDSGAVLMQLDTAGIACSSGSACATGSTTPSHVLSAMGVPAPLATASLRFSFSHQSTAGDVDRVLEVLPQAVQRVRTLVSSLDAPESRS